MKTRLLIIDDDTAILELMKQLFEGEGMEVFIEESGSLRSGSLRPSTPMLPLSISLSPADPAWKSSLQ